MECKLCCVATITIIYSYVWARVCDPVTFKESELHSIGRPRIQHMPIYCLGPTMRRKKEVIMGSKMSGGKQKTCVLSLVYGSL